MAITANWFSQALVGQFGATASRRIDWVGATVKCGLTTSAWTPDQDAHDFRDDVTNEVTGTGYSAGGVAVTGKALNYDAATNILQMRAAVTTFSTVTIAAIRRAFLYVSLGGLASADPLLGWADFGADQAPAGIDFVITWDATQGALRLTIS